jgi:hypothetical protein
MRILVVDYHDDMRNALCATLKSYTKILSCDQAASGETA